jgi:nitroreductase
MDSFEKNVFDAINGRRSIRAYEDRELRGEIIRLLQAGMEAPSPATPALGIYSYN